jgi:aldose 1-epimerase
MAAAPSGDAWTIAYDGHEVTVVEVGGGLRSYRMGGIDVVAGYGADEQCSQGRGQVLMPWPNRIRDGRYRFAGREHQLALTEPARRNASHGLVRWAPWQLLERTSSHLEVACRLHPQPGWPGVLDLRTSYAVSGDGLVVEHRAVNVGATPVPFGCGAHPYVAIGDTPRREVRLTIPASVQVLVDAERLLPTGTATVDGTATDFRTARALGDTQLDTAYTELDRDGTGRWQVLVSGLRDRPDVTVWGDRSFDWVQAFTGAADDDTPGARGVAIEPMSCPADAFNSGDGLVVLQPGESWSGRWGIVAGA